MNDKILKAIDDTRVAADIFRSTIDAVVVLPGCPAFLRAARPIIDAIVALIDAADDAARKAK